MMGKASQIVVTGLLLLYDGSMLLR